jgi:hypothetical protein
MLAALRFSIVRRFRGYTLACCPACGRPGVGGVRERIRVLRWWGWVLWESTQPLEHAIDCPHCSYEATDAGPATDYHFSDNPHVLAAVCRPHHLARFLAQAAAPPAKRGVPFVSGGGMER